MPSRCAWTSGSTASTLPSADARIRSSGGTPAAGSANNQDALQIRHSPAWPSARATPDLALRVLDAYRNPDGGYG